MLDYPSYKTLKYVTNPILQGINKIKFIKKKKNFNFNITMQVVNARKDHDCIAQFQESSKCQLMRKQGAKRIYTSKYTNSGRQGDTDVLPIRVHLLLRKQQHDIPDSLIQTDRKDNTFNYAETQIVAAHMKQRLNLDIYFLVPH